MFYSVYSDTYGLNGTLLILTGLDMNCAVLALLWKPPMAEKSADEINDKGINNAGVQCQSGDMKSNKITYTTSEYASTNDPDNLGNRSALITKDLHKEDSQSVDCNFEHGVTQKQSSSHCTQIENGITEELEIYDKVTHQAHIKITLVNDIDSTLKSHSGHEPAFSGDTTDITYSQNSDTVKWLYNSRIEENTYVRHLYNENLKLDNHIFENSCQSSIPRIDRDCRDLAKSTANVEKISLTFKEKMKNMLTVKSFVFILIGLALSLNVSLMFIVFIVDIIMDRGYTEDQGTVGLTILTIANVLGRLTHGTLLPCPFDTTFILPIIATALSSLAMVILALVDNLAVYYVLSCILGNALGVQVSVIVVTTSQILEVQYLPYAIGTLITVTGLPNLAVGPIAGCIQLYLF